MPTRTLEVRWFVHGAVPAAVEAWFDGIGEATAPERRTDRYLAPTDAGLGVKHSRGAAEAKRREDAGETLRVGRAAAPVETWAKWSLPLAETATAPDEWVAVDKSRRQHREGTAAAGCSMELTALTVGGEAWWSVALEATAAEAADRTRLLREASAAWLGRPDAPALDATDAAGYPAWLLALAAAGVPR